VTFTLRGDQNNVLLVLAVCSLIFIMKKYIGCFRTKLYLLCKCGPVQQFVRHVDYLFYQNLVEVLIPDVLRPIPSEYDTSFIAYSNCPCHTKGTQIALVALFNKSSYACTFEIIHVHNFCSVLK
jgi:hypothetical protein